jgi:hypothetical protein
LLLKLLLKLLLLKLLLLSVELSWFHWYPLLTFFFFGFVFSFFLNTRYAAQRLVAVAIMALKKCHAYIRRFDACQVALLSNGSRSSSATSGSSTGEKFAVSSPSSSLMCENGGDDDGSATAASAAGAPAAANAASAASVAELSSLVHVYGQCACGLVALLNAGLRPKALSKNPELVYALMHRKGDFLAAAHMYVPPTTTAASNDGQFKEMRKILYSHGI